MFKITRNSQLLVPLLVLSLYGLSAACSDEKPNPQNTPSQQDAAADTPLDSGENVVPADAAPADAAFTAEDAATETVDDAASTPDGHVPADDVVRLALGSFTTQADGRTAPFRFTLPEGAVSFTLVADGIQDKLLIVHRLTGPAGVIVSDDASKAPELLRYFLGPFAGQFVGPNRTTQEDGIAVALVPNNPNVAVTGGEYEAVIAAYELAGQNPRPIVSEVEVSVYYRKTESLRGRLDINLYLTGAGGLTAASAANDRFVQDALIFLRETYAQASIELGEIRYFDIDASYQTLEISTSGSGGRIAEMFRLTAGGPPGLNFFLVQRFDGQFGGSVGGVAGGIPGAPLQPGSDSAGVAVALAATNGAAEMLGHIMGHEGGHWLGLYHTTEIIGAADQLADTPEGEAGNEHLMYPAVGGGRLVSSSQATTMRHHIEVLRQQ